MGNSGSLRQRRRGRRHRMSFLSRVRRGLIHIGHERIERKWQALALVLVLILAITLALHPSPKPVLATGANGFVGVRLTHTAESLPGFKWASKEGNQGVFFHGDLLLLVRCRVYRCEVANEERQRTETIAGKPTEDGPFVVVDGSYLMADVSILPYRMAGTKEHTEDAKPAIFDLRDRLVWRHRVGTRVRTG